MTRYIKLSFPLLVVVCLVLFTFSSRVFAENTTSSAKIITFPLKEATASSKVTSSSGNVFGPYLQQRSNQTKKDATFTIPADYSQQLSAQKDGYAISFTPIIQSHIKAEATDNILLYRDAQPQTNILYQALNYGLKESLVLKDQNAPHEFSWQVKISDNLTIKKVGNSLAFFDKSFSPSAKTMPSDWPKEKIFEIPAPFMVDAKGNRSEAIIFEITKGILTLKADSEWLKTANYPVTIDPTITYVGPNYSLTINDSSEVGTIAWNYPANISQIDNNFASIPISVGDYISHYLKATNFNFNIPTNAKIMGIVVGIQRKDIPAGVGSYTKDYEVKLIKNSILGTTNYADTVNTWPIYSDYKTYGSQSDLWGTTWTPADINSANFGVAFSVSVRQGIPCYVDSDNDGYGSGAVQNCYGSIGAGYSANNTDCNASDSTKWQVLSGYIDADHDGYGSTTPGSVCSGASLPIGYSANSTDCNDSDVNKWRYLSGYTDADGDGYGVGSLQSVCSGSLLASGYTAANNTDCYDSNTNAHPGQTGWFATNRGDGSFDYNCDGSQTLMRGDYRQKAACAANGCAGPCGGQEIPANNVAGDIQSSCGVTSLYSCYTDCGSGDNQNCWSAGSYWAWDGSNEGSCPANTCRGGYGNQPGGGCIYRCSGSETSQCH